MRTVSLICTFHEERGRVSVSELHAILERIRPDVIFLEVPSDSVQDKFFIEKLNSLESNAVLRYREGHSVELVSVDLSTPDRFFFRNAEEFFNEIEKSSYEYRRLIDENKKIIMSEGFAYLNGELHCKLQAELDKAILETIEKKSSKWMAEMYAAWRHTMEVRDVEMLANIENYCRNNEFTRAAFLVGAAHRASIIAKSSKQHLSQSTEIKWDYSGNWYE